MRGILFSLILFPAALFSQEVLTDLTNNPVLIKKNQTIKNNSLKITPSVLDTLALPFLDDFSKDNIYPDASLWLDSNVFINRDLPICPPTLGVATFDGVSKSGCPYDTTLLNAGASRPADTLTSKPIDLALAPSDSIYFSFFWQAKGRGNDPEHDDSLLLEFLDPVLQKWDTVWHKNGYNPSTADTLFRLMMIPITNPKYLKNAFQFRFRNEATISGNVDHWHIDYVLLDKNRNMGDTIFSDVAFAYNCKSLLKNYYSMPWRQYDPAVDMKTNLDFFIRNNDTVTKNIFFNYQLSDNSGNVAADYTGGNANCLPYSTNGYLNTSSMSNPGIGTNVPPPMALIPYSFPTLTDTASFSIECALNTTPDKDRWNDTVRFRQNFYNYYAYDDGTAEGGYGLNVYGGQLAYKFTLNQPDTLVALQMLFNWIPPKVSQRQFRICVWADAGGYPGALLYKDSIVSPKYEYQFHDTWGNLTNMYYPYKLTTPKALSGTFYVGLIQYCCNGSNELLNIGYDKNTNSASKMFYDAGNGWNQTALPTPGSWMIRPVFGDTTGLMSVHEQMTSEFNVYPNPSYGIFNIQSKAEGTRPDGSVGRGKWQTAEVFNMFGEKVYAINNSANNSEIDLTDKPSGIYFLRIRDEKGVVHSQKIIIAK